MSYDEGEREGDEPPLCEACGGNGWRDGNVPTKTYADPLHPYGRCTCTGEGRCAYCQLACPVCMGDGTVN